MSKVTGIEKATVRWAEGRREEALRLLCLAVAEAARRAYPGEEEGAAFTRLLTRELPPLRMTTTFRGRRIPLERLFYEWVRPSGPAIERAPFEIEVADDLRGLSMRGGPADGPALLVSPGWFEVLRSAARAGAGT